MMFGARWEITLKMRLEGPMHVGSGVRQRDGALLSKEDQKQEKLPPEVSEVQRDKNGKAIIPATSLKGALRAQAPLANRERDELLGEQGEAEAGKGRIARLWLGAAIAEDRNDGQEKTRFQGMTKTGGLRPQGFVKTAVRIHRASGTSEDKLLYNREVIGSGIRFVTTAILFLDGCDKDVLRGQLARLLAPLASHPGLLIGGQHRQAGGRLLLDELRIDPRDIDPVTLDLASYPEPDLARHICQEAAATGSRGEHEVFRLLLTCDGPYISVRDKTREDGDESEMTRPLSSCRREQDGTEVNEPFLWASSLLGALRARAAWLAEVERLRNYAAGHDFAPSREADRAIDDRDDVIVLRNDQVAALSSVERLFGVAGWRGLITVASLKACEDGLIAKLPMTSITIDRFTGGGMDQRLFTEHTFLSAQFICELRLEQRAKSLTEPSQQAADRALFELLLTDIRRKGLELGHGAAKGFGWFKVSLLDADRETRQ